MEGEKFYYEVSPVVSAVLRWLNSGASTDFARPVLQNVNFENGVMTTTDGYAIHQWDISQGNVEVIKPSKYKFSTKQEKVYEKALLTYENIKYLAGLNGNYKIRFITRTFLQFIEGVADNGKKWDFPDYKKIIGSNGPVSLRASNADAKAFNLLMSVNRNYLHRALSLGSVSAGSGAIHFRLGNKIEIDFGKVEPFGSAMALLMPMSYGNADYNGESQVQGGIGLVPAIGYEVGERHYGDSFLNFKSVS